MQNYKLQIFALSKLACSDQNHTEIFGYSCNLSPQNNFVKAKHESANYLIFFIDDIYFYPIFTFSWGQVEFSNPIKSAQKHKKNLEKCIPCFQKL